MTKVDRIRYLLDNGASAKEAARDAGCALSLVYQVKGLSGMARLRHEIGVLKEENREIRERLRLLEGGPEDIVERMLARNARSG